MLTYQIVYILSYVVLSDYLTWTQHRCQYCSSYAPVCPTVGLMCMAMRIFHTPSDPRNSDRENDCPLEYPLCHELTLSQSPEGMYISTIFIYVNTNCCCQSSLYSQTDHFQNPVGDLPPPPSELISQMHNYLV